MAWAKTNPNITTYWQPVLETMVERHRYPYVGGVKIQNLNISTYFKRGSCSHLNIEHGSFYPLQSMCLWSMVHICMYIYMYIYIYVYIYVHTAESNMNFIARYNAQI